MRSRNFCVPGKQNPGILTNLGDEGVDNRPPCGFGIDRCKMGLGQHLPNDPPRLPGVDQIIDDQPSKAFILNGFAFENVRLALFGIVIGRDANSVDIAYIEFAADYVRWDKPTPA